MKYDNINKIMRSFYDFRLNLYHERKDWLLERLDYDRLLNDNKKRFIQMQIDGQLNIMKKDVTEVNKELKNLKFTTQNELDKKLENLEKNIRSILTDEEDTTGAKEDEGKDSDFDYLLNMSIKSFTNKKIKEVTDTLEKINSEINQLKKKSPIDLWTDDLKELENAYEKFIKTWETHHIEKTGKKIKARNVKKTAVKNKKFDDKDKKSVKPKKLPGMEDDAK